MNNLTNSILDAYLRRINYEGPLGLDARTLSALTQAHSQSIAFENIDVLLGHEISLRPDEIVRKLITQRRGGYCFEQNLLFLWVLRFLGFSAQPGGGRVRLGLDDRAQVPARTHLFCLIDLNGQRWFSDVGFGSYSLTAALLLQGLTPQPTPHGVRRFEPQGDRWFYQAQTDEQWQDLYEFNPNEIMHPADQKVANWYTQTHADTHFTYRLSVSRALPGGGRAALLNRRLRQVDSDGNEELYEIAHARQLAEVLEDVFLLNAASVAKPLWKKIRSTE
ncbi:MAG TPA: arylamine N-acetyltransferase [Paenalcaligenes sp.]|nr:arylamine N-acetyltransferase [Paenalcaligenes sp.]